MSGSGSSLSLAVSASPLSIGPMIKAIRSRDLEALSKLRHSLRTPLNQIIGYSEMLMESAEENKAASILADLKRIHTCGGQLLSLENRDRQNRLSRHAARHAYPA